MADKNETMEKMRALGIKKALLVNTLVAPARAACNAMLDAGMTRSADPLSEKLFEIDAVDDEIKALIGEDQDGFVTGLIDMTKGMWGDKL